MVELLCTAMRAVESTDLNSKDVGVLLNLPRDWSGWVDRSTANNRATGNSVAPFLWLSYLRGTRSRTGREILVAAQDSELASALAGSATSGWEDFRCRTWRCCPTTGAPFRCRCQTGAGFP